MSFQDVPFEKPKPTEDTIIRWYNNNQNASVISRRYKSGNHLHYKRVKGNQMLNTLTKETKPYKHNENKLAKNVWKKLKQSNELIQNNFWGKPNEKIFQVEFEEPIDDRKEIKKKGKNFRERLQRKIPNTVFIMILLYITPYQPVLAIWVKTLDDTPIVIDQATADKICNSNEKVKIIDVTEDNIKKLSSYHNNRKYRKDIYPANIEICTFSEEIKQVQEDANQYSESEQKLIGYVPKFQKAKAEFVTIMGEKQEVQRITIQEFVKVDSSSEPKVIKEEKIINNDEEFIKEQEEGLAEMKESLKEYNRLTAEAVKEMQDGAKEMQEYNNALNQK